MSTYAEKPKSYSGQFSLDPYRAGYDQTPQVVVQQPNVHRGRVYTQQQEPPSYLGLAIFSCLCCFWPTGICAINAASNANTAIQAGDMNKAKEMSDKARTLSIISIILGVIAITVFIVLKVVVLEQSSNDTNNNL